MHNDSSYDVAQIAASVDAEIQRLGAQVDLFAPRELRMYQRFGLRPGSDVIELGCGPGFVLQQIRAAIPDVKLTGLEIDELLADRAREILGMSYGTAVEVVNGSIEDTPFPDASFDFAITRLVLEHLGDPLIGLREVYRILRPGGTAVFVDNDFATHLMTHPHIAELGDLYAAYCRCRVDEGGNPMIGRELPGLLRAVGFTEIDFEVLTAHSQVTGVDAFLRSEGAGIAVKLIRDGYLQSQTLARLAVRWRELIRRDDHAIVRQLYAAAGRKPAA